MTMTKMTDQPVYFGLYGAGGFAREVMPVAKMCLADTFQNARLQFTFIEEAPSVKSVNNITLISEDEFVKKAIDTKRFNVAIADSRYRQKVAEQLLGHGIAPLTIKASNATLYDQNEIAEGAIFCAFSTITSNVKIGKFFHCNIYSYVAHDCVIGDYVTFAPNVHCNGHVHIKDHAYIGTGAILKPGTKDKPLTIGEGAIVGMGAVVTKDVEPYTTVIGSPARPFKK